MMFCPDCDQPLPRDRCALPGCRPAVVPRRMNRDEADREAIKRATGYHVTRLLGRARYESFGEHGTLEEARVAKTAAGRDSWGRPAMIYALVHGRTSIFVE